MRIVGCDFHTRFQQISMLNCKTGELLERRLWHQGKEVEEFYGALGGAAVVGIESTGYCIWFHELLAELGIELKVGDAAAIRAKQVRKKKNDLQDARLIRTLLEEHRFPQIWVIDAEGRDLRFVLSRRRQLVKMRTSVKNTLQSLALNHRLALGPSLFSKAGREAFRGLTLRPHAREAAAELWEQFDELDPRIRRLDRVIETECRRRPEAMLLRTHPGVGWQTALAWVLIVGPVERFARAAQLAAYVGLVPSERSTGGKRRLGRISKQGSKLLRYLLVEAGCSASRHEPGLRRFYRRLLVRRGVAKAKTAVARKLSNRLYVMHRDGIDYAEFQRRGLSARPVREMRDCSESTA